MCSRLGAAPLRVAISPISRDQLPAALRRIANSGEAHSEQWPSQPGRPFGSFTSRGSAMVTFWPQTHQLCGSGSCTSSLCGSTMCHNHILGLPASYAGRAIDGLAASRTRAPGRPLRRFRLAPEAIESVQLHADLTIRGEARVRPRKGRRYRSLRRPLLKRKTGPAGIPCASESVASARCSRLSCLCSLWAGIDGRRASSTRLLLSGHKNEGVSLIVSPDPPYGVCGEGAGLVAPHSPKSEQRSAGEEHTPAGARGKGLLTPLVPSAATASGAKQKRAARNGSEKSVGSAGALDARLCDPHWSGFIPPPPRSVHAVLPHTADRRP
jgi:hypothetical protein